MLIEKVDKLENRFGTLETRLDRVEIKVDVLGTKVDRMETQMKVMFQELSGQRTDITEIKNNVAGIFRNHGERLVKLETAR